MSAETRIKRVTKEDLGKTVDMLGESASQIMAAKSNSDNCEYTILFSYTLPTMTIDEPEDSVDLFGLDSGDLQDDVSFSNGVATATLKYVTGYTGFSGNPDLQEGNYFATSTTTEGADKVTVQYQTEKGGWGKEYKVYDSEDSSVYDGVFVMRLGSKPLKFVVRFYDLDNDEVTTQEYDCDFKMTQVYDVNNEAHAIPMDVSEYSTLTAITNKEKGSGTVYNFQYSLDGGDWTAVQTSAFPAEIDVSEASEFKAAYNAGGTSTLYYIVE